MMSSARVLIGQPFRGLVPRGEQRVIYDLFTPILLELGQMQRSIRMGIKTLLERKRLERALRTGDLLIVAAPEQRLYYQDYASRAGIEIGENWIEVPFGIERRDIPRLLAASPPELVWNGGVWPWMDADLAVSAVRRLNREGFYCRLIFSGTKRPLLSQTGRDSVGDDVVEWNEAWTPYEERGKRLAKARAMIMLHHATPEGEHSYRIRFADAMWAKLPVIATRGGAAARIIEKEGLGLVIDAEDEDQATEAIRRMLEDDVFHASCVSSLERVREGFHWDRVTAPLRDAVETLIRE